MKKSVFAALKMGEFVLVNAYFSGNDMERLAHGIRLKAKREGTCSLSGRPIKIGDPIVWDKRSGRVAHQEEADQLIERTKADDADMRMMGY